MTTAARPVLFLDVDGTLIPFGGSGTTPAPRVTASSNPYLDRIDRTLGPLLAGLECDLVWATTWMDEANEVIAPLLGLPHLPVAGPADQEDEDDPGDLQWKTKAVVRAAAGRPFIWVDDVIGPVDRWWIEVAHPGPALLHQVDPAIGLTAPDIAGIEAWLREVGS